jgi:hypothetical protein
MTRQIRIVRATPLISFYFIHSVSILNRADALSKILPTFELHPPLEGIGQVRKKHRMRTSPL